MNSLLLLNEKNIIATLEDRETYWHLNVKKIDQLFWIKQETDN